MSRTILCIVYGSGMVGLGDGWRESPRRLARADTHGAVGAAAPAADQKAGSLSEPITIAARRAANQGGPAFTGVLYAAEGESTGTSPSIGGQRHVSIPPG
jgi:hypothetical protein